MRLADVVLVDEGATRGLGARIEPHLRGGDVVGLEGDLGAGKSVLARGAIASAAARAGVTLEAIPSPSFTLVQYYPRPVADDDVDVDDAGALLWHVDLWRIEHVDEVLELGLDEAMAGGTGAGTVCFIEWMRKLGDAVPPNALTIHLEKTAATARTAHFDADDAYADYWRRVLRAAKII